MPQKTSPKILKEKQSHALNVMEILRKLYPNAQVTLDYGTGFQLLVSTVLAAQCTDERVNQVTPGLFARYPTPEAFAEADELELQEIIRSTGFFRQKARSIIEISRGIVGDFDGRVPDTLEELTSLRGIGRKTANLVLGIVYGKPAIVVDTHVKRISARLGWTEQKDPTKVEFDLMEVLPEESWIEINHLLVAHGRAICKAPTPLCERCPVLDICPFGKARMGVK